MRNKWLYILGFFAMLLASACSQLDNYAEPAETLTGKIIDRVTGEPLVSEQPNGFRIRLLETSWSETPQPEYFWGKADGTFVNTKIFAGTYEVTPVEGAFFDVEPRSIEIKGKVNVDFEVIPYLSIDVLQIERTSPETLEVSYRFSRSKIGDKILDSRVFVSTNPNVGTNIMDADLSPMRDFSEIDDIDALSNTYVEKIEGLNPKKTYYVKVGARTNNSSKRYNFSKTYILN